jgi:hypothetical protein
MSLSSSSPALPATASRNKRERLHVFYGTKILFSNYSITAMTPNCSVGSAAQEGIETRGLGSAVALKPTTDAYKGCSCSSTGAGLIPGPAPQYYSVIKSLLDHTTLSIKHKLGQSVPRACPSCPPSMTSTQISTFANNGSAILFTAKA